MKKILFVFAIAVITGVSMMSFVIKEPEVQNISEEFSYEEKIPGWLSNLLNGFEVSWIRGWYSAEANHCVERGMCEFHVSVGGISKPVGDLMKQTYIRETRFAGFDASGNMFILVFNPTSEDFNGTNFYQDSDIAVPNEIVQIARKSSYTIKKGSYPIEKDPNGKWIAVRFLK